MGSSASGMVCADEIKVADESAENSELGLTASVGLGWVMMMGIEQGTCCVSELFNSSCSVLDCSDGWIKLSTDWSAETWEAR